MCIRDRYFNSELSQLLVKKYSKPDLIITNNVYAHVPNINDFTRGIKNLLKDDGVWTLEFPYLKNLLELNQFDTIYHEHYYYFSLHAIDSIFRYHELKIFDVEELPSHGGSLRLFITHSSNRSHHVTDKFSELMNQENIYGLHNKDVYGDFKLKVNKIKSDLTGLIEKARSEHKKIAGYGAAGKGNTLLNFCGITPLQIDFIVDRNPLKQNKLMPGSRIPIFHPETILTAKPDYILILPWNLKKEIMESNKFISNWGGKFILPIPEVQILEEAA
jgi:hypothetical protein